MTLKVGDTFPAIELPDADGNKVSLDTWRGKQALVVYFYPADDTPGCTRQACSFRDQYQDFLDAGADVVGISSDSPARHRKFAQRHGLPFTLLSDSSGTVRRQLQIPKALGVIPGRVTYVLDKDGTIVYIFKSQVQATRHIKEALQTIRASAS